MPRTFSKYAIWATVAALTVALTFVSCAPPPKPQQIGQADVLWQELSSSFTPKFAPYEFRRFENRLKEARDIYIENEAKFRILRKYEKVAAAYEEAIKQGELARQMAQQSVDAQGADAETRAKALGEKLVKLRDLAQNINEGRLALSKVTRAEMSLGEAQLHAKALRFDKAREYLARCTAYIEMAESTLTNVTGRYADPGKLAQWQTDFRETIEQSRRTGGYAIVVSKADRALYLYRAGQVVKTYEVTLGSNGSMDKLRAGDRATPEGQYHVSKKVPNSAYHKALLLNYPNDEDRQRFAMLKKKGVISKKAGIGGLIEIHGGGTAGMTYGCIGMDDREMEALFSTVGVGTPVTIVGAKDGNNPIAELHRSLN